MRSPPFCDRRPGRSGPAVLLFCFAAACLPVSFLRAAEVEAEVAPSAAATPDALKRMSVEDLLNQPVVSASRMPEAWSQAASDIFLLRGQAAASTGATVLPELLRMATNLYVAQVSSSQWAVDARGFVRSNGQSNKLLVTVDGRSVYSPLFSNVFWDSTSVFLPDLDRIEVISGPAGSTWGSNAVNGVISISTKSARDTLGGLVFGTAGTDVQNFGVRYGVKAGSSGAIRFYAQQAAHGSTLSPKGVDDDADKWRSRQAGMRGDWGDDASGQLTVQADYFEGRYDNLPSPQTTSDNGNVLVRWSKDLSADSHFWVRAYNDYDKRDNQGALIEITRTTDVEFQHNLKFGDNQELLWGANYRFMSDTAHGVGFAILPASLDFGLGSVFAQHELKLAHDALQLTTGLRMEHNHFSGWETEPNVRLAWHLPSQTIWAAASRAARIPSRLETGFFQPATPPYIVVGGANVVAEVVNAYEVGWRATPTKNFSVTSTLYSQEYDHLRSVEPTTPFTFANGVQGRSYGLEAFVDWDVLSWWRMRVGGFRMNQESWYRPGGADLEHTKGEESFPDYQMQFRNTFRLGDTVTFWTSLRHVSSVPANDTGGGEVPAYTDLDASLTWPASADLEFSLTGRNLLDASHPEIGGLAARREIRRSGEFAVRFKF
ncbi:MAG TPA: TonB-dependent receptor [Opitutaceae bacterium]|nr:TonB-dependent receptor [Opitutaceae bacterium]